MHKLKVQFSGGLGNQLFTYAAFKYFADMYEQELILDCSVVERVLERDADLLNFKLDGENVIRRRDISHLSDYLNRISWRNAMTRRMFRRKLYPNLTDKFDFSASLGASSNRGFFQTPEHFEKISNLNREAWFNLRSATIRFEELKGEVIAVEPIAIHVRRGDYRTYQNSFGLLDTLYFEKGVELLQKKYGERQVWLFSDEPAAVVQEFEKSSIYISKIIYPEEINSAETLKLMSLAYAQVISNSTFSWWAGALSNSQRVVFPDPWFKFNEGWLSQNNLALPNWIALDSTWLQ
jgi:hypothetical protein